MSRSQWLAALAIAVLLIVVVCWHRGAAPRPSHMTDETNCVKSLPTPGDLCSGAPASHVGPRVATIIGDDRCPCCPAPTEGWSAPDARGVRTYFNGAYTVTDSTGVGAPARVQRTTRPLANAWTRAPSPLRTGPWAQNNRFHDAAWYELRDRPVAPMWTPGVMKTYDGDADTQTCYLRGDGRGAYRSMEDCQFWVGQRPSWPDL